MLSPLVRRKDFILRIRKVKNVVEARLALGNWDAVAKIEAEDLTDLQKVFFNGIDKIPIITNSRLCIKARPRTIK